MLQGKWRAYLLVRFPKPAYPVRHLCVTHAAFTHTVQAQVTLQGLLQYLELFDVT